MTNRQTRGNPALIMVSLFAIVLVLLTVHTLFPPASVAGNAGDAFLPVLAAPGSGRTGCAVAIMPLGDSITQGHGDPQITGYRRELYNSLADVGYVVNFAGSRRDGVPLDFDRDNESHPGQQAYEIRDGITAYLNENQPDIILLHIGTNGIAGKSPEAVAQEIDEILSRIYGFDGDIVVFLARIINRVGPVEVAHKTSRLNELIQAMANERIAAGDPLVVVDMERVLTYSFLNSNGQTVLIDMFDTLHPNATGYKKMAVVWDAALQGYLYHYCLTVHAPRMTSTPDTSALVAIPYSDHVEASGNPAPTFSLQQSPPGMTIDPATGLINWTPAAAGDFTVTVSAANGVNPPAARTFAIHVAKESLCPAETSVYYHLDETATPFADALGGPPALCGNCPASTSGKVNRALLFDGTGDGLAVAAAGSLFDWGRRDDFTVEFWLKRPGACLGNTSGYNEVVVGRADSSGNLAWWVGVSCPHGGRARFVLRDSDGDHSDTADVVSQTVLTGGAWHHVAVVRDWPATEIRVYVDGQLEGVARAFFSSGFESDSADLDIGWFNLGDGFRFEGSLDEPAIYDRALTDGEIYQHFAAGLNGQVYCRVGTLSD